MAIPNPLVTESADTAAHRLASLLERSMRFPRQMLAREVWARAVSGVGPDAIVPQVNDLVAAAAATEVFRLASEFDKELNLLPELSRKPHKKVVDELLKSVRLELMQAQWAETASRIEQAHLVHKLELAASHLGGIVHVRLIAEEQLKTWAGVADELRVAILADVNTSDELRRTLVESLDFLSEAMSEYRLRGRDGLQVAVERFLGRLIRLQEDLREVGGQAHSRQWLVRLGDFLKDIEQVTTSAKTITENVRAIGATIAISAILALPPVAQSSGHADDLRSIPLEEIVTRRFHAEDAVIAAPDIVP